MLENQHRLLIGPLVDVTGPKSQGSVTEIKWPVATLEVRDGLVLGIGLEHYG